MTLAASSCSATPTSLTLGAGSTDVATVEFVAGPADSSGTVTLEAARSGDLATSGQATVDVMTLAGVEEPPIVSVADLNPGTTVERGLCLTAAMGGGGIAECGDLRLSHALPTTTTFNKTRTPILTYSSQHGHPTPVVTAEVALSDTAAIPDEVQASLTLEGESSPVAEGTWPGTAFVQGAARRITLTFDARGRGTGILDFSLEVTAVHGSEQRTAAPRSGRLVVVDRSDSPFGAGWWLAGWERLVFPTDSTVLWVGGDGSTRLYEPAATDVWVAASHTRPDTLRSVGGEYVRRLPAGVEVRFDGMGRHVRTVDRLGRATVFTPRSGGEGLARITLAVPSAAPAAREYEFVHDSVGKLDRVVAPPVGSTPRATEITVVGGALEAITDPDGRGIAFDYGPSTERVVERTDPRGTVTSFAYDGAGKLEAAHVFMGAGTTPTDDDIVTTLRSPESQGLAPSASAPAETYVRLDGPRAASVGDTTAFHLDRFGQPTRLRDPLGHETLLAREDDRFPGLVTSVTHPSGQVIEANYNARGLPESVTDSATHDPVKGYATTHYEWHPVWPSPTRITRPEGDFVAMDYESNGNRDWREDARGNRVDFLYHETGDFAGMASGVELPETPASAFAYDVYGNLASVTTPEGFTTTYDRDDIGRPKVKETPIDGTKVQKRQTEYDIMGRPILQQTIGPAMNGAVEQTVTVETAYDAAGAPDTLRRMMSPDTAEIGVMETISWYDGAGRVIQEQAPDGVQDSTVYDPAGNVIAKHNRRGDVITMVYDALNRLRAHHVPSFTYPKRFESIPHYRRIGTNVPHHEHPPYPRYPNTSSGGLELAAQVDTFTYDAMGRMRTADNPFARVLRTYHPNGTLESETLRVRTVAPTDSGGDFDTHVYTTEFTYDLNGRRTDLIHPTQLAPSAGDRTTYDYDSETGLLETVTDPMENAFTYHYDARSQPDSLYLPGGLREGYAYDDDGRLETHRVINESTSPYRYVDDELRNTTLHYDQRNKLLRTDNSVGSMDTLRADYSGLGHLVRDSVTSRTTTIGGATVRFESLETFTYDPLGNQQHSLSDWFMESLTGSGTKSGFGGGSYDYVPGVGRVESRSIGTWRTDVYEFDAAGNEVFAMTDSSYAYWTSEDPYVEDRASFYDALGRLRVVDKRDIKDVVAPATGFSWTYEEHRYDALGRRIWSRARRGCNDEYHSYSDQCRLDFVRRFVWDGEQELWEIQMPGGDSTAVDTLENDVDPVEGPPVTHNFADTDSHFGRVLYTHGLALDRPLSVVRFNYADRQGSSNPYSVWPTFTIVPLWNHKGQPDLGTFGDGGANHCRQIDGETRCVLLEWPAGWSAYAKHQYVTDPRAFWHGSLLEDKKDYAGTFYRRNRYYDPATGRFTQEDPIGLAGGINLYGFAGGDPLNLSDPFGLCEEDDEFCLELVSLLRELDKPVFSRAADAIDEYKGGRVRFVDREALDPQRAVLGEVNNDTGDLLFASDLAKGDLAIVAVHESRHLPTDLSGGLSHADVPYQYFYDVEAQAYRSLPNPGPYLAPEHYFRLRNGYDIKLIRPLPPIGR